MPDTPGRIVVIGGGLAAAKAVEALRREGYEGKLDLVTDEADLPYERPPLSKEYLQGKAEFDKAVPHDEQWYTDHDITLHRLTAVMSIDRERHQLELSDSEILRYDKLVLATGAVPRKLDLPGAEAVKYLRTHNDSDFLKQAFGPDKKVVVIGGGWIGLETAAAARNAGADVTVLESLELPLLGVLGKQMAEVFAQLHRDNGVDLRLGVKISEIVLDDDGAAKAVELDDGTTIDADLVIAGVGVVPEDSLARMAGLDVDNGVLVTASLRTSDGDIYAVGDVANHDHPILGRLRVEHWANALNQPAAAAKALLGDSNARYDNMPYFFTDQYDLGMEYVGFAPRDSYAKVVVRGDTGKREFVAFWLDDENHVLAAMNVNVWDVVEELKPIIAERQVVDPDKLTDSSVDWADVVVRDEDDDD
ncbi:MAG TPA: FAD-dependent oxidoreductase [Jatrophihabitans sp.]|jgi:NADPH-dependent 2,4-dienoyl-CoA reductase/sulfur reductase-like enzyme